MKLTARIVEGPAREKVTAERFEWDDEIPGLGIRMRPGGSRNWVFQYKPGKKHRRMTLGALSPALAAARDPATGSSGNEDLATAMRLIEEEFPVSDWIEAADLAAWGRKAGIAENTLHRPQQTWGCS
jgi:hypothetical protein